MPKISHTAEIMPESAIRMLTPYADQCKADGIKVYHLNIGAPDIKSPSSAAEAVAGFQFDHLPYSNSAGTYALRRAIIEKYYKPIGLQFGMDDLLVTVAGSEALRHGQCDRFIRRQDLLIYPGLLRPSDLRERGLRIHL